MMRTKMFGQAETTDYSTLTEAACALVPACVAWKAAGGEGALSTATGEVATQVKEAIGSGMAPAIVQLQRLESTITWAAVGTIVALVAATGTVIYFSVRRRS